MTTTQTAFPQADDTLTMERWSVLSIQIEGGEIPVRVRGSRPKPYLVRIRLAAFRTGETKILKDS